MKIKKNYEFGFLKIFFYSLLTLSIFFIFFEITSRFFVSTVAKNFKVLVPHSEYVDVSDAGHMVAGDKNDIFTEAILEFMSKVDI